mgnify:CR=1 FL=1
MLGSVGQPRDGDPAASFAMLDTDIARDHLLPRALRCRGGGGADPRTTACRTGWPIACSSGSEAMAKPSIEPGADHRWLHRSASASTSGGMATLWTRDPSRHHRAAVDEGAAGFRGRGSGGHRQLRDGADDRAAAVGTARAGAVSAPAISTRQAYVVIGAHPRQDAVRAGSTICRCLTKRRG